jgi:hypothetical protein
MMEAGERINLILLVAELKLIKNTYMTKEKKNGLEKVLGVVVPVGAIAIAVIATLYLFVFKQDCSGIDQIYMYCRIHPMGFFDVIGLILFYSSCFWLSSLWKFLVKDDDQDPWQTVTKIAWVAGPVGFLLIYGL